MTRPLLGMIAGAVLAAGANDTCSSGGSGGQAGGGRPSSSADSAAPTASPAAKPSPRTGPPASDGARLYLVRDNGVRCVTYPCFSLTARDLADGSETTISRLDLSALGLSREEMLRTSDAVLTGRLPARGTIREVPNDGPAGPGRVLFVTGTGAGSPQAGGGR